MIFDQTPLATKVVLFLSLSVKHTVKPVLIATSDQQPPVNNGQPNPQTSQTNCSYIGETFE